MPAGLNHGAESRRCESPAQQLQASGDSFCDWEITALFYAAMHLLDDYFSVLSNPPAHHRRRLRQLTKAPLAFHSEADLRASEARLDQLREQAIRASGMPTATPEVTNYDVAVQER